MSPSSERPSNHWKSLARELGADWGEEESPAPEPELSEAAPRETEPLDTEHVEGEFPEAELPEVAETPMSELSHFPEDRAAERESAEREAYSRYDEEGEPRDALFDEEDALFGSEVEQPTAYDAALDETRESAADATSLGDAELELDEAAPTEPVAPADPEPSRDREHWRALLDDLGLELPPEPEPEAAPSPAPASPAADLLAQPERFGEAKAKHASSEGGKSGPTAQRGRGTTRRAPPQPVSSGDFGMGLFSDEEESQFERRKPPAEAAPKAVSSLAPVEPMAEEEDDAEESEVEHILEEAESIFDEAETTLDDAATTPTEEKDEAAPKKRGRRRTRRWKRLHTSAETSETGADEEAQSSEDLSGEMEVVEAAEEMGVADDLFGDLEESPREEAEPSEEDQPRRRRRRRRRRSRKGERGAESSSESSDMAEESDDLQDDDADQEDVERERDRLFDDEEEDEEFEERDDLDDADDEEEDAPRDRRRRSAVASGEEAERQVARHAAGDDRPTHRKIPTWEEAVGFVIEQNLQARAKQGGGRRRR